MDESMKANAPNKIYTDENGNNPLLKRHCDSDIEYTRTDTFIEKAMKFLYDYNKNMVKKHGARAVLSGFTINVYDFRKYMKGE